MLKVWATPKNGFDTNSIAYDIWNSLNFSIMLTGNHRQREDQIFLEICRDVRFGTMSEKNLQILNSRVISSSPELPPLHERTYL